MENGALEDVIKEIEERTDLHFFYVEDWMKSVTVTANFQNMYVEDVLEQVFEETLLNFHILDNNRIVITRSNIIYDRLPQGFFPDTTGIAVEQPTESTKYNPVFYNKERRSTTNTKTVYIGKETQATGSGYFNLSGRVTTHETGEPISNLAVLIKGTEIGTVTDQNGQYSLRLPAGEHLLETRSFGNEDILT